MEIHARYIWVGLLTFVAILATVWYILWISISKDGSTQVLYDIYFSQNIAGLQEGSSVLLRGVPVGRVISIRFDPKRAEQVRVRIQVTNTAPVRQDSIATIEPQGITGLANIQITGGSPTSPFLRPLDNMDIPIINAGTSRFEEILSAVPNILVTTTTILNKVNDALNPENIKLVETILRGAADTVENIASQKENINAFLVDTAEAFRVFKHTNDVFTAYIDTQLTPLTSTLESVALKVPKTIDLINSRIEDISALAVDTQKTILQAKIFFINLDKVLRSFKENPKQFFFGNALPTYQQ